MIEGLVYRADLVSPEEERALLERLALLPFGEVRMRGVVAKRTVVHYGWDYGYESWKIHPTEPLPEFLVPVRDRAAELAGLPAGALEATLIARYPAGAGIGWHRDAPMYGPVVVGVSLLTACVMRFRPSARETRPLLRVPLEPRSGYVLSGPARSSWQH